MRMERKQQGQEALEFALISGLVFFVAIGVVVVFGEKIANFFSNNTAVAFSNHSTSVISENNYSNFKDNSLVTYAENPTPTQEIEINGKSYNIPQETVKAIEAAGSPGMEDIIAEIAYLTSNDPDAEVEIDLGHSIGPKAYMIMPDNDERYERLNGADNVIKEAVYGGRDSFSANMSVETNSVVIKVGNKVVILDKEVGCEGSACEVYKADRYYRIEGSIDSNNNFSGKVTSKDGKYVVDSIYKTTVNAEDGLVFDSAKIYDPFIENLKTKIAENNTYFRKVVKNLENGDYRDYSIAEKQEIKELILELRNKYKGQYDVALDVRGLFGVNNEAILVGLLQEGKGIEFEQDKSYTVTPAKEKNIDQDYELVPTGGSSGGSSSSGGGGGGHAAAQMMKQTE